jgi:ribosome-binding protein aMBF1 (putative translation factor)
MSKAKDRLIENIMFEALGHRIDRSLNQRNRSGNMHKANRNPPGTVAVKKTGDTVGRKKREPDLTTYSGRVASRLRELREAKGWPVEKLAEKLGIKVRALYAYESGTRTLDPDLYPDVADAFRMKLHDFLPRA